MTDVLSLAKGDVLNLSKKAPGYSKFSFRLGWRGRKVGEPSKPSLLGKLFGATEGPVRYENVDLDASVIIYYTTGATEIVSFGNLTSRNRAIVHSGDDRTGKNSSGLSDNEIIRMDLSLFTGVKAVVLIVNDFNGPGFAGVDQAYVRVVNEQIDEEVARYVFSEQDRYTGLIMANLVPNGADWNFRTIGRFCGGRTANSSIGAVESGDLV